MVYTFCILTCNLEDLNNYWIDSCNKFNQKFTSINITDLNWLNQVIECNADCYLLIPPGNLSYAKKMFDERVYIISEVLKKNVYPSYEETFVYENKRLLSDYLKAKNIRHPKTYVLYSREETINFSKNVPFPIVAKTNIGAAGSGVKILKTMSELLYYSKLAFTKGIQRRKGPNKNLGNPMSWTKKAVSSPQYLLKKLKLYHKTGQDRQKHFIILQEFIPHDYEWRVVKIGESYFAHKKSKIGEMASGTKNKIYDNPPLSLLDFMKQVCDKTGFYSQAVDIFEDDDGNYLVNEIQTIFGQSDEYQMIVDNKIGRYIYDNGWAFEEGDFNSNKSYDLRIKHAIELISGSFRNV